MKVQEYVTEDGNSPYKKWFNSLNSIAAAKISVAILRIEAGNISNIKWFEGIGEYKVNWGPGYRIYLAKEGARLIILFGGGSKKSQKKDITEAKRLHQEYKKRKKSEGEKK